MEELGDLKEVWSELQKVWQGVNQLKELPWLSINSRKLRQTLDGHFSDLKAFPAKLRQYASYEYITKTIREYTKVGLFFCGSITKSSRFKIKIKILLKSPCWAHDPYFDHDYVVRRPIG